MIHSLHIRRALVRLGLLAAVAAAPAAHAAEIHVPGNFQTITIAINFANNGDEIVVAPGTYNEKIDLGSKNLIIRSSSGPKVTFIDAFGQFTHAVTIAGGQSSATVIEGFTIMNGNATGASTPDDRGGGIYSSGASPTIRDCIITANVANQGGGSYANGGSPTFENCQFIGNISNGHGGAASVVSANSTFIDCRFEDNSANGSFAGAVRFVHGTHTMTRCEFFGNTCNTFGGAIHSDGTVTIAVNESWFEGNFSGDGNDSGRGGAIHAAGTGATTIVTNSVFLDNGATVVGGALSAFGGSILARNCTFYGNTTESGSGGVATGAGPAFHNCIAWSNGPSPIPTGNTVQYSNIENGYAGPGNIGSSPSDEPLFFDAANGDLRLLEGSPGIDAGNTESVPFDVDNDFDGNMRVVNGLASDATGAPIFGYYVDMGAFEFQGAPGGGPDPTCPADLTGSGSVGVADLLQLLSAWGPCP